VKGWAGCGPGGRRGHLLGDYDLRTTAADSIGYSHRGALSQPLCPSAEVVGACTPTGPVAGTVRVYKEGAEPLSGWSVDVTAGIVTFTTAPAAGVAITADFELDVPVRFDTDHMAVTIESFKLHRWQQIPIVELRT
jgi:Conserved hypothetical protein 2217 (DUF2460)